MKKSRFKQKSFSTALYATLGVALVGAVAYAFYVANSQPQAVPVSAMHPSALHMQQPVPPPAPPRPTPVPAGPAVPRQPVTQAPAMTTADQHAGIREFFNQGQDTPDSGQEPAPQAPATEPTPEPVQEPAAAVPVTPVPETARFTAFTGESNMLWPVVGEVALEYSSEAMIWDPTLEQFARNSTMRIGTMAGEHVRAATDGQVSRVFEDSRYGQTVVIDHGNGWETTYNQLDGLTIAEGDVVATGQILGVVGEPTRFTTALGDNVGFRVTHNAESVNPLSLLP